MGFVKIRTNPGAVPTVERSISSGGGGPQQVYSSGDPYDGFSPGPFGPTASGEGPAALGAVTFDVESESDAVYIQAMTGVELIRFTWFTFTLTTPEEWDSSGYPFETYFRFGDGDLGFGNSINYGVYPQLLMTGLPSGRYTVGLDIDWTLSNPELGYHKVGGYLTVHVGLMGSASPGVEYP